MNFYTRKTKLEDFIKKDESYILGDDENTFPKFTKKYPYSANYRPRWTSQNKMINRLGRFEALMRKYDISSPKNMEEKLIRLEELEKKETPITKEEVLKKFKELGYKHKPKEEFSHMIYLVNDDEKKKWILTISINTETKIYWKLWGDGVFEPFTFEEHQLLNELFKCEGWFDE